MPTKMKRGTTLIATRHKRGSLFSFLFFFFFFFLGGGGGIAVLLEHFTTIVCKDVCDDVWKMPGDFSDCVSVPGLCVADFL